MKRYFSACAVSLIALAVSGPLWAQDAGRDYEPVTDEMILDPDPADIGIEELRLNRHRHTDLERDIETVGEHGEFIDLQSDPVAHKLHSILVPSHEVVSIGSLGHHLDRLKKFAEAMQCQKVGLQWQKHFIHGSHGVERQQTE